MQITLSSAIYGFLNESHVIKKCIMEIITSIRKGNKILKHFRLAIARVPPLPLVGILIIKVLLCLEYTAVKQA